MLPASVLCTEFEMQARHLHLTPAQYIGSVHLRRWCEENKNQYYIPEWLLKTWKISVIRILPVPHNLPERHRLRSNPPRCQGHCRPRLSAG